MGTIGAKDTKILIQKTLDTEDKAGSPIQAWNYAAEAWAEKIFLTGTEKSVNEQQEAKATYLFITEKIRVVNDKMRIQDRDRTYKITSIDDTPKDEMRITAEWVDSDDGTSYWD